MQVANYILWSLLLAAYQVCSCAIVWKLSTLPDTSKPSLLLHLLFVCFTRGTFWLQLLKRCRRRFCGPRKVSRQRAIRIVAHTPGTESVQLQTPNERSESGYCKESTPPEEDVKVAIEEEELEDNKGVSNVEEELVIAKYIIGKTQKSYSWVAVALGLNRVTTIAYLLGNALTFTFYLYPLLYRIIVHSAVIGYIIDTD